MSGPKIIIVRSPAELQRERDQTLRELAARTAEWQSCLQRNGELAGDTIAKVEQRLKELENAFLAGHDSGMATVTREISFLKSEIERLKGEAVRKLAKQKQQRSSISSTARALLQDSSNKIPQSSKDCIQRMISQASSASNAELLSFDNELSKIVNGLLQVKESAAQYSANSDFVRNLAAGVEAAPQYAGTKSQTEPEKETRLNLLLAEIELLDGPGSAESFSERASTAEMEANPARKQLLFDSLLIDLSQYYRNQKNKADALRILNRLKTELELSENSAGSPLKEKLVLALKTPNLKDAELLEKEVQECIRLAGARQDAAEKRKTILAGFAALGYEVKEGMATGWAKNGRIVVSKKSTPDVGIEIGSTETVERIQMRVVGIVNDVATRDTSNDKEIETEWCSELAKIRDVLKDSGHATSIETAMAAGTAPLKTIKSQVWVEEETEEYRKSPRENKRLRSIDRT